MYKKRPKLEPRMALITAMKMANMTNQLLSAKSMVPASVLSRITGGRQNPDADEIKQICKALKKTPDEIFPYFQTR